MTKLLDQVLSALGFAEADINRPGILPDSWGFSAAPTLQQLKQPPNSHPAETSREGQRRLYPNADTESYVSILQSDHAFISNHSVHAMAEAYGVSQVAASLSGSLLAGTFDSRAADAAVQAIRQQVDSAWSAEAVRQGVGCAKAGDYQQAIVCYNKALQLNPSNCDAFVARGAAHANLKIFTSAVVDFELALQLDPSNANAAKYLQATKQHMQTVAAEKSPTRRAYTSAGAAAAGRAVQEQQQQDMSARQQHRQQQQAHRRSRSPAYDRQHRHEQEQRSAEQQDHNDHRQSRHELQIRGRGTAAWRPRSRSRSRSRSSGNSGSSSSSGTDSSSSDDEGTGHKLLKGPTADDIKKAIEMVRSAKKASRKERHKGSKAKKKRQRHKHSSKHKRHKKHKGHKYS